MGLEEMKDTAMRSHVNVAHGQPREWIDQQSAEELRRWHEQTGCQQ